MSLPLCTSVFFRKTCHVKVYWGINIPPVRITTTQRTCVGNSNKIVGGFLFLLLNARCRHILLIRLFLFVYHVFFNDIHLKLLEYKIDYLKLVAFLLSWFIYFDGGKIWIVTKNISEIRRTHPLYTNAGFRWWGSFFLGSFLFLNNFIILLPIHT